MRLSGGVRLTAPGPRGRGRIALSPAPRAPGPRYAVASREAARQPIAPTSAVDDRPAIVTTASRWSVAMRTVSMSGLRYGPAVDLRSRRAATRRVVGTVSLLAGLLISALTALTDSGQAGLSGQVELHVLAGLLVLVGAGLRIEAAIIAPEA